MLPKKGRRKIIVNDTIYFYSIKDCILITILNSNTSKVFQHYKDCKPKWQIQIKPNDVEKLIKENKL